MRPRGQATVETLLVMGSAIFLVFLAYTVLRSQAVGPGLSSVNAQSGNISSEVSNFSPSPRAGNVSAPPDIFIPNPCANCTTNTTCPSGLDLIKQCIEECAYDHCAPCNARCGLNCKTLDGQGQNYTMTDDLSVEDVCFVISANNVELDCAGHSIIGAGNTSALLLLGVGVNGFIARNCRIGNFTTGVNLTSSVSAVIQNSVFANVDYGIVDKNSNNPTFYNITVVSPRISGFYITSSNNANITACNVTNAGSYGAHFYGSSNGEVTNCNITNASTAVFLEASTSGVDIKGNTLFRSRANGIAMLSSSGEAEYNNISNSAFYGVNVTGGSQAGINHNNISGVGSGGVYLVNSNQPEVQSNSISLPAGAYGVRMQSNVTSADLKQNTFTGGACPIYYCASGACGSCPSKSQAGCDAKLASNSPQQCTALAPGGFG